MKVDAMLAATSIEGLAAEARGREAADYAGLWTYESAHDPFLPIMPVAEHTATIEVGTAIAVAFARSPMQLAYVAHDVQAYTGGRLLLGLGSQVKPHIERRFAMPWSRPAARMREYVSALRAIWTAWDQGERLDFRGEFYSHTLMTPMFSPPPNPAPPQVLLAAVGEKMTEVAGEVCDGLLPHPFTSERYLREVTVPTVQRGLDAAGRSLDDFTIGLNGFVVTGRTEGEMAAAVAGTRKQIAFYASTPAYRAVLDLHGWGDVGVELNTMSRSREKDTWDRMADLVTDEMLATFAVVGAPDEIGPEILRRFGGAVDRFTFYAAYEHDDAVWEPAIAALRAAG